MIAESTSSYPDKRQSWGIVGLVILSMVLLSPVSLVLDKFTTKEISFFFYYLIAMGIPFWIVHRRKVNRTGVNGYNFTLGSAKTIALVAVTMVALQIGVVSPLVYLLPMPEFVKDLFLKFAEQKGFFSFITLVIAAPVLEELIFRGIILNGLLQKYAPVKAIFFSSILFGLVHLNPWQFLGAFVGGIFMGWVYYKTRKLTLTILIHLVNNLAAFVSLHFSDAKAMMDKPLPEMYGGYVNLSLTIVAAIFTLAAGLYYLNAEFKRSENSLDPAVQPV